MRSHALTHSLASRHRLSLLAAVALMALAGCAGARARGSATTAPTATFALGGKFATATAQSWTPTLPPDAGAHMPIPGVALQWTAANLPLSSAYFGFSYHTAWLDVSADNGAVAYSCSQGAPSVALETVVTRDAGATWSRVADVNQAWGGCMGLAADALNPRIVVLTGGAGGASAVTLNGGQSWRVGSSPITSTLWSLATFGSHTYTLSSNGGAGGSAIRLYRSADGLVSWRDVSPPMGSQTIPAFWVNPITGSLLVESQAGFGGPMTLWRSSDDGSTWTQNILALGDISAVVASPLRGSSTWVICVDADDHECSTDSGRTWSPLPPLVDTGLRGYRLLAVTGDGSVLAVGSTDMYQPIYRLAPGASRWQALGPAPLTTGTLHYTPAPGTDGYIWSFPSIRGGGAGDAQPSDVLVARYPY